jgi:hypothetical protein
MVGLLAALRRVLSLSLAHSEWGHPGRLESVGLNLDAECVVQIHLRAWVEMHLLCGEAESCLCCRHRARLSGVPDGSSHWWNYRREPLA